MKCIYCLRDATGKPHRAHVFPEGLVGDWYLVLENGEVCAECNGETARFEHYLIEQLGFLGVLLGSGVTKRNKPKRVGQRGIYYDRDPRRPMVLMNFGDKRWHSPYGPTVAGARGRFEAVGGPGDSGMAFAQHLRVNKRVCRAAAKIAFETLCFDRGREFVLSPSFDTVRSYIRYGLGNRLFASASNFVEHAERGLLPQVGVTVDEYFGTGQYAGSVSLGLTFLVDLSPSNWITNDAYRRFPVEVRKTAFLYRDNEGAQLTITTGITGGVRQRTADEILEDRLSSD